MPTLIQQLQALASNSIVYRLGYIRLIGIINRSGINVAITALRPVIDFDKCPYKREEAAKAMAVLEAHQSRTFTAAGADKHTYLTL